MYPSVKEVVAGTDYVLSIVFDNGERLQGAEAADTFDYLLHNLPPNLRVVIGTRSPLPAEALDLLARGLNAGHAFASGLEMVGEEMPNPVGLEFFKTFKEYNHGMDMNTARLNLCQREDLKELRFFTTAVVIQRETGGNLTEILEKIAGLIRERFKLRNQIKALTAEGRLSGWVLILMPPVFDVEAVSGRVEIGTLIDIAPGAKKAIRYTWTVPGNLDFVESGNLIYLIRKQAGTGADPLTIKINLHRPG